MKRPLFAVVAAAAALSMLAGSLPGADAVTATGAGSSRSQAAEVTPGAGITVAPSVTVLPGLNVVTALTALLTTANALSNNLTTSVATPIANALVAVPNSVTSSLTNTLMASGLRAASGDSQQPRPSSGYPTCGQRGWNADNCFGPVAPAVSAPPAVTLGTGALQGYATGDNTGYIAAARAANPVINLLGFPLGDLGVISSSASCGLTQTSCTASQSFSGGSLLRNQLTLSLADGGDLVAKIGGVAVPASGKTITVDGFVTTVTTNGNLATIKVALTLAQLLAALGLPNLLSSYSGGGLLVDDGTTATLTIKIGPGNVSKSSPASAWGIDVSADLSAAVKLKVVNVANLSLATVTLTSTSTPPSLVDLKLAYSTATAGTLPPGWVSPALI